jgi:hypothetical protein
MSFRRKITWACLIVLAIGIKAFSWYPEAVEKYYSRGVYLFLARGQRLLFGWLPFSVGDILYGAAVVLLLYRLVRLIGELVRRQAERGWLLRLMRRTVFVLLWVYVLFNGLWGLNYNRLGIADEFVLKVRPYSNADLFEFMAVVAGELNALHDSAKVLRGGLEHASLLRAGAAAAYDSLARPDPFFTYSSPSVKPSLFSYPGLYIGFAGYYNPFTGEAQVNTMDPPVSQPFTTCHEIGHQLGFAREDEADFVGFMAARSSTDPAFQYSLYLDLYRHGIRELYVQDSVLARTLGEKLAPGIREDLQEIKRFNGQHENPLESWIWNMYGRYLQANRQPEGTGAYSEMMACMIAYGKKWGLDAIRPRWEIGPH